MGGPEAPPWADVVATPATEAASRDAKAKEAAILCKCDEQLSRLQRALALVKRCGPDESGVVRRCKILVGGFGRPLDFPFERDACLVAVTADVERTIDGRLSHVALGASSLDTCLLKDTAFGNFDRGWTDEIRARSFTRECRKQMTLSDNPIAHARMMMAQAIAKTVRKKDQDIIVLMHDSKRTMQNLEAIGFDLRKLINVIDIIDVADLAVACEDQEIWRLSRETRPTQPYRNPFAMAFKPSLPEIERHLAMRLPGYLYRTDDDDLGGKWAHCCCDAYAVLRASIKLAIRARWPLRDPLIAKAVCCGGEFPGPFLVVKTAEEKRLYDLKYKLSSNTTLTAGQIEEHIQHDIATHTVDVATAHGGSPLKGLPGAKATLPPFREARAYSGLPSTVHGGKMPYSVRRMHAYYKENADHFARSTRRALDGKPEAMRWYRVVPHITIDSAFGYLAVIRLASEYKVLDVCIVAALSREVAGRPVVDGWYASLPDADQRKSQLAEHQNFTEMASEALRNCVEFLGSAADKELKAVSEDITCTVDRMTQMERNVDARVALKKEWTLQIEVAFAWRASMK